MACHRRSPYFTPQECFYCPEKIYCSKLCQAMKWPEHKLDCKMGEAREILKDKELEWENLDDEITALRVEVEKAKTFKAKAAGLCSRGCDLQGELRCTTCAGVYCSVKCHRRAGQCPSGF